MSLLIKGAAGVTTLSALTIDADKDWMLKAISRLAGLDTGQVRGDIWMFDLEDHADLVVKRLQAMEMGKVLCSRGPGKPPFWAWGWEEPGLSSTLAKFYPALIDLTHDEDIVIVAQSISKSPAIATSYKQAYDDAPADYIKRLTPAVALTDAEVIVAAAQSYNKNAPVARKYDLEIVVGGAVADDGGVQTDETAAAQSAAANDMTLLPAVPAVNDAYYFGHAKVFDVMKLNIGTQGSGVWTITWEYWNGAWVALAGVVDGTNGFTAAAGNKEVTFTRPGDWALTAILAMNLYWIRARVSAYTSIVTQPKGTQSWIRIIT